MPLEPMQKTHRHTHPDLVFKEVFLATLFDTFNFILKQQRLERIGNPHY